MTMFQSVCIGALSMCLLACSSGTYVVTGQVLPEIDADQVRIFNEPPAFEYVVVGTVSASSDNGFTEETRREKALREMKEQAAKIGANGMIVDDVTQLSFRRLGTGVGVSVGSNSGVGAGIGSSFSFPTAQAKGTAIHYDANIEQ
ncbi:hypothetical protein J9B83_06740 [Marinomonas sp. A79]|uniref:DUF4156 domain-containing protein n=1 Tax=Marinomonas vulgaris TaxID=2823372 RepID=A0ABS5HB05_9GAMM|nr:hypothetical protein [Marinomonas vulgaris]MBR7888637.1 hypothetical protein [Marinomonas vulgaris]